MPVRDRRGQRAPRRGCGCGRSGTDTGCRQQHGGRRSWRSAWPSRPRARSPCARMRRRRCRSLGQRWWSASSRATVLRRYDRLAMCAVASARRAPSRRRRTPYRRRASCATVADAGLVRVLVRVADRGCPSGARRIDDGPAASTAQSAQPPDGGAPADGDVVTRLISGDLTSADVRRSPRVGRGARQAGASGRDRALGQRRHDRACTARDRHRCSGRRPGSPFRWASRSCRPTPPARSCRRRLRRHRPGAVVMGQTSADLRGAARRRRRSRSSPPTAPSSRTRSRYVADAEVGGTELVMAPPQADQLGDAGQPGAHLGLVIAAARSTPRWPRTGSSAPTCGSAGPGLRPVRTARSAWPDEAAARRVRLPGERQRVGVAGERLGRG